jgi:hypothetical protein
MRSRTDCAVVSGMEAAARLEHLGEQLAADQHAADLAGAGADLVQLGVAPQAAGAGTR